MTRWGCYLCCISPSTSESTFDGRNDAVAHVADHNADVQMYLRKIEVGEQTALCDW